MTPQLAAWKARIEALPYFDKTYPAALEKIGVMRCSCTTSAFADNGVIPGEFAFAVIDPATHVRLSANRNPDFAWSDAPAGTRSFAMVCHDPDVPSRGDDVNQEGRDVPASLPRVDFFHWALIDLPPSTHGDRARLALGRRDRPRQAGSACAARRHATASTTTRAGSRATRR